MHWMVFKPVNIALMRILFQGCVYLSAAFFPIFMLCNAGQPFFPSPNARGKHQTHHTHITAQVPPIHKTEMSKLRTFLTLDFSIPWSKRDVHPLRLISPSTPEGLSQLQMNLRLCNENPTSVYTTNRVPQRMSRIIKTIKHLRISVKSIKGYSYRDTVFLHYCPSPSPFTFCSERWRRKISSNKDPF